MEATEEEDWERFRPQEYTFFQAKPSLSFFKMYLLGVGGLNNKYNRILIRFNDISYFQTEHLFVYIKMAEQTGFDLDPLTLH